MKLIGTLVGFLALFGCSSATPEDAGIPAGLHPVTPVVSKPASNAPPAVPLQIARGKFFSYALPSGWHLGEDGQFALSVAAADNKAFTVMVGNAGLPPGYPPDRFVYEKLMALQPQNLRISQGRKATPVSGFTQAYAFDVEYNARGMANKGIAKVHVATAYDTAVLAMTAAISEAGQWQSYSSWLPAVSEQISALNGGAFGARGIMAQNLANSKAFGEAAQQYREWSQRTQQQVTDARNASQDKNNFAFRENIGGIQTYTNPYDTRVPVELPTTYKYYWANSNGTYAGTDDPSVNPNAGSTTEWKQLPRFQK
jgi:hypothetical protein